MISPCLDVSSLFLLPLGFFPSASAFWQVDRKEDEETSHEHEGDRDGGCEDAFVHLWTEKSVRGGEEERRMGSEVKSLP